MGVPIKSYVWHCVPFLTFLVTISRNWLSCVYVRLRAKEGDLALCEKKLLSAESQVNELQARLNDAVNQRRHWEDEYNVSSYRIPYASHLSLQG